MEEVDAITNDLQQNLEKINHHGKRASSIVKGMLEHSQQQDQGEKNLPISMHSLMNTYGWPIMA